MGDHIGVHIFHGRRTAQPRRVRAFIELAVARLLDCPQYVLKPGELREARSGSKRTQRR
jgi:hypothetical protein